MKKKFILLLCLFVLCGCAANVADTVVVPAEGGLKSRLAGKVIYAQACDASAANLKVSHYQGLFRVPQPSFIAGLPKADRDSLLQAAVNIAQYNFLKRIEDSGAKLFPYTDERSMAKGSMRLKCSISRIRINIYDNGFGGFGSAGDFWEAETEFTGLSVVKDGREYAINPISTKGQLNHAPLNPGTFLDALLISAKAATAAVNGAVIGYYNTFKIDYRTNFEAKSPVEPAALLAGDEAVRQIGDIFSR